MMIGLVLLQAAAVAAPAPAPAWKMTDRTNAAGVRSVSAALTARDGLSRFLVKCDIAQEKIVSVQFSQPNPLGQSADKPVAVRFDGGLAVTSYWSFPGNAAYVADAGDVTRLTTMLVKAKQVAVEATTAAGFAVRADFAVPPGDAAIRQILGACGYTLGVVPPTAPPPPPPADAPTP